MGACWLEVPVNQIEVMSMSNAVKVFEGLVVSNEEYEEFSVTQAGEPYYDEIYDFVVRGNDLKIPALGIDFRVTDKRKNVTDHYESKTYYDLVVDFVDQSTGKAYEVVTDVYKGMDGSYRSIVVTELTQEAPAPKSKKKSSPKKPKVSKEDAQALVSFLGSCFKVRGRELYITSDELGELLYDPFDGTEETVGAYRFVVESSDEEITDESDAWSLGFVRVVLQEQTLKAEVVVTMGLFLGQDREIRDVYIGCDKAEFELAAK
jgi:hypothetical protein